MSTKTVVTKKFHLTTGNKGRQRIKPDPAPVTDTPHGRVPRLSRLMALAIKLDGIIKEGGVYSQADLAELGYVSRARVTQIMNLLHLAPDIQEEILYLPQVIKGRDPVTERDIRKVTREVDWGKQRRVWGKIQENSRHKSPLLIFK